MRAVATLCLLLRTAKFVQPGLPSTRTRVSTGQ